MKPKLCEQASRSSNDSVKGLSGGSGERQSMAICKRLSAIFVSNERRVKHHCLGNGIDCVNLIEILRALWEHGILMQADVRKVITEIETKDNLKFRTTDPIFK